MKVIETEKSKNIEAILDDQRREIEKLVDDRKKLVQLLNYARSNMLSLAARSNNQTIWDSCLKLSNSIDDAILEK